MDAAELQKQLRLLGACDEARAWAEGKSLSEAWAACERGDWMLWLAGRLVSILRLLEWNEEANVLRKQVVLAACACARLALPHVRAGDVRPLQAIETAERWARGEPGVTLEDVRKTYAYAADADADADAAAYAAYAAYADAAYAADAAAYAAAYAAAARRKALAACADLVRQHITVELVLAALEARLK